MYSQINEKSASDRLSVADILSSMANGTEESPTFVTQCSSIDGLTCGIPTRTTPTLTPTTLKNIEECFLELHTIPPAPLEHQHQAGFAPPMVTFPVIPKQEDAVNQWIEDSVHSSDKSMDSPRPASNTSTGSRPMKTGRSGGRRPIKDEKLSPEEEERRRIRRERNKLAAARCRKRRMELTSNLMNETDGLEEKRQNLQHEIQLLQCQKEELEFLLEAHKATCKLTAHSPKAKVLSSGHRQKGCLRPNSLALSSNLNTIESLPKTSISESLNTPSAGLFQFEPLLEGAQTGGLPPALGSCGGQQRSSSSDLSSPDAISPPKLVSL